MSWLEMSRYELRQHRRSRNCCYRVVSNTLRPGGVKHVAARRQRYSRVAVMSASVLEPASALPPAASPHGGRRRRHLDRALAADPPQGPGHALRLRSAPALRDLGGEPVSRRPRQGDRAVPRAPPRSRRPHRLRPPPAHLAHGASRPAGAVRISGDRAARASIAAALPVMTSLPTPPAPFTAAVPSSRFDCSILPPGIVDAGAEHSMPSPNNAAAASKIEPVSNAS